MGKQLTARRGEPAGAIAAVERREARVNRVRIARAGAERYLAVDKRGAKVTRGTVLVTPSRPLVERSPEA